MQLFGESDPSPIGGGYIPGAWDEVRRAYLDGHITQEAYDLLFNAMIPLREQFDRDLEKAREEAKDE